MLQSIRLTLQSHKATLVEFHPGVNYIIGRSRQGKTAILRALVKLAQNRPVQGMERWVHKHDPKNIPEVEVVTSEGHSVTWEGGSPQRYIVDGEELSGFGQGVPQAVTNALQLGELNIAGQHELPFLLFDTPGEVARTLNRVVRLDVIDRALANHATIKRKNDQETKAVEARINELEGQAGAFPDLEAGAAKLTILEGKNKEIEDKGHKIIGLEILQRQLASLKASLEATRAPDGVPESVDWLLEVQDEIADKSSKQDRLMGLQHELGALRGQMALLQPGIAQDGQVISLIQKHSVLAAKTIKLDGLLRLQGDLAAGRKSMAMLEPGLAQDGWLTEALTKQNHLQNKRKHIARLVGLNEHINQAKSTVAGQTAIIKQMEMAIKDEFGVQCPLCGQAVKK